MEAAYMLHISLKGSKPLIWRRIRVRSGVTFLDLHTAIQVAMGWMDSHLFAFRFANGNEVGLPDEDFPDGTLDAATIYLPEKIEGKGHQFFYTYDFGDFWLHEIKVEDIEELSSDEILPVCTGGAQSCPPEDSGGLAGYYNMLEILKKPKHEEYEDISSWIGDDFDPDSFQLDSVNQELRASFKA